MKLRCFGGKNLNSKIGNEKTKQKKVVISELILVFLRSPKVMIATFRISEESRLIKT